MLAEIETDKATMEVEAVDEGTLAKILVPEGTENVAVNTPIAVLAGEDEDVAEAPKPRRQSRAAEAAEAPQPHEAPEPRRGEPTARRRRPRRRRPPRRTGPARPSR